MIYANQKWNYGKAKHARPAHSNIADIY